jgi:hypothetical protein
MADFWLIALVLVLAAAIYLGAALMRAHKPLPVDDEIHLVPVPNADPNGNPVWRCRTSAGMVWVEEVFHGDDGPVHCISTFFRGNVTQVYYEARSVPMTERFIARKLEEHKALVAEIAAMRKARR